MRVSDGGDAGHIFGVPADAYGDCLEDANARPGVAGPIGRRHHRQAQFPAVEIALAFELQVAPVRCDALAIPASLIQNM